MASLVLAACVPTGTESVPDINFDDQVGASRRVVADAPQTEGAPADQTGPLEVTVQEAVLLALEHNRALAVHRVQPAIASTFAAEERAEFDTTAGGEIYGGRSRVEQPRQNAPGSRSSAAEEMGGRVVLGKYFPTGTDLEVEIESSIADSTTQEERLAAARAGLTVSQALLQGRGLGPNLARLRQANLDVLASEYELRGFAEALVADSESACWDYALARREIEIFEESLSLAEKQLGETKDRIEIGKLAGSELAAAQAEVALRKEDLINAASELATARIRLLQLMNPPTADSFWERKVELLDKPAAPDVELEAVNDHVAVAMQLRPDLNQARLALQRNELELVRTKNGLLPRLDLFVALGKSGYSDSFGGSVEDISGRAYDITAGLALEYPLGNRAARARHTRALCSREQAAEALLNLEQLAQVDVHTAYIEVNRSREQIAATAATRALQEEKFRSETEKFRVGTSTSLLVAQAQRDLTASMISEIRAVVTYLKALIRLHRADGSLLDRRGLFAPGGRPVRENRQDSLEMDEGE